jgi:Zn finger protein HypA/HybF involved in hydrogenase expression
MTTAFPPPGYIPVESAIQGIEIYKPAPVEEKQPDTVDFSCPQCGAKTAYSISDGGLKCTSCGYYEPPSKEIVGKGAQEFEFKVETMEQAARGWGEARKQIECQSCYAITTLPPGQMTLTCPFCGSSSVVQGDASQDALRPRFIIPFKETLEDCRGRVDEWLGSNWLTPRKLRQMAGLGTFTAIYLPFWTFDARTSASWRAQVGYDRTERYYSNGEWKTRTVTDWRWESGRVIRLFDDLLVSGTAKIKEGVLACINTFDMNNLAPYEATYLAGYQAQSYDTPLETAWETGRSQMREDTRLACRADALDHGGDHIRSFTMQLDFNDESWRHILLPVYLATYDYGEENYQVVVNGETGAVGGERPVDWTKIILLIAAALALTVVAGLVGIAFPPLLCVAGVLFVGTIGGAIALVSYAQSIVDPNRTRWTPFRRKTS